MRPYGRMVYFCGLSDVLIKFYLLNHSPVFPKSVSVTRVAGSSFDDKPISTHGQRSQVELGYCTADSSRGLPHGMDTDDRRYL